MTLQGEPDAPERATDVAPGSDVTRGAFGPSALHLVRVAALVVLAGVLASCSGPSAKLGKTKEHFSSRVYGKASPRVVHYGPVPKGGGRYLVGAPYRVAGHTYIPRDNPNYSAVGYASWYGSAFHGRRTANGEIYDVNGLTAAHPTLPLPSYVRVTNLENGRSLIVRVNDRGPFKRGRLIDVSERAAGMLGFQRDGTAKVRVDYMGPAPLNGNDERKLLASYRGPGGGGAGGGTMFAWNGPPKGGAGSAASGGNSGAGGGGIRGGTLFATAPLKPIFGGGGNTRVAMAAPPPVPVPAPTRAPAPAPRAIADAPAAAPMVLMPSSPDATTDDPLAPLIMRSSFVTSFAEPPRMSPAQKAAATLASAAPDTGSKSDLKSALDRAAAAKARTLRGTNAVGTVVQLGAFGNPDNARRLAAEFDRFGEVETRAESINGRSLTVVSVALDASVSPDAVLKAANASGLPGAYIVSH